MIRVNRKSQEAGFQLADEACLADCEKFEYVYGAEARP